MLLITKNANKRNYFIYLLFNSTYSWAVLIFSHETHFIGKSQVYRKRH